MGGRRWAILSFGLKSLTRVERDQLSHRGLAFAVGRDFFYDLTGPCNLSAELRADHFLPFTIMVLISSFMVAFVVSMIVFFFAAASEKAE